MSVRQEAKWKREYRATIEEMSDADLFEEVLDMWGAANSEVCDDKDTWKSTVSLTALRRRLEGIGFL
jgi:hypothetical protein